MHLKFFFSFLLLVSVLSSCEMDEGVGGTATISGTLVTQQYNDDFSLLVNTFPAADEKIYIQYGDSKSVSDDVETSYDGYFEFPYLYEGDYTIFYYSQDSLDPLSPEKEVLIEVSIGKGESKSLGELNFLESLDYDEGKASIHGTVYEIDYWANDTLIANDLEVYIRYGTHKQYDDRIRTQEDGSFYFTNLIPGEYTIYVFSENIDRTDQQVAIDKTITISTNDETEYSLGDYFIYNL